MGIKLNISVPNHLKDDAEDIKVDLDVNSMKVFDPNTIASSYTRVGFITTS